MRTHFKMYSSTIENVACCLSVDTVNELEESITFNTDLVTCPYCIYALKQLGVVHELSEQRKQYFELVRTFEELKEKYDRRTSGFYIKLLLGYWTQLWTYFKAIGRSM